LDYNPAFQFIYEADMARILVRSILEVPTGVYNVTPDETILIRDALKLCGNRGLPLPLFVVTPITRLFNKVGNAFPDYLFEYLKYACLIDNKLMKGYLGKGFLKYNIKKTLQSLAH